MRKVGRSGLFAGAMAAAVMTMGAGPAVGQELTRYGKYTFGDVFNPVLLGNGPSFCGPCEPGPTVTQAAPHTAVLAARYRWSLAEGRFVSLGVEEVGATDHQGELRFKLPNAEDALDRVIVSVGGQPSNAILFLTTAACGGPRLCPLPRRLHAFTNLTQYLPGQDVYVTLTGATRGSVLDIAHEAYVGEGDGGIWVPVGDPHRVEVDPLGRATVIVSAADPGVYRAVARDRETGEESSVALFEVGGRR
jgi:hypothetical protein